MTTEHVLQEEFESIRADLERKHIELGMKASGNWIDSLEVQVEGNQNRIVGRLLGEEYTKQLQFGRRPGKMPPVKAIESWLFHKGIQPIEQKMKLSSLAFLIARKIKEEGTKYYQQGGTDLIDSVITPERIQSVLDKVTEINITFFINGYINELKQVA